MQSEQLQEPVELRRAEVLTFGGLRARNASGEAMVFRTRKIASLFSYLSTHAGKDVTRESLCGIFWPDSEESFGRNSLSNALTSLRRQLHCEAVPASEIVVGDNRAVRLNYEFIYCDALEFHRKLKKATLVDEHEKLAVLFDALDLVEGPFLSDDEEAWARLERYRCDQNFYQALCTVLDKACSEADMHKALNIATKALSWGPKHPDVVERVDKIRQKLGMTESAQYKRSKATAPPFQKDEQRLLKELEALLGTTPEELPASSGEHLGGAVPLTSKYYVTREADEELREAIAGQESIILVKGPRQIGKSSLLARGIAQAREAGATVLLTDFQSLDSECLQSTATMYRCLICLMLDQLGRSESAESFWDEQRAPAANLERFMRNQVLNEHNQVFWGMDEVDRVFTCPFYSDFFGLLRSWHNRRAMDPTGAWNRLMMVITYSTEAHAFISDLNQSPFNVGIPLELRDFDLRQLGDLNQRHGNILKNLADLQDFFDLTGGHPFLVRRGLFWLADRKMSYADLKRSALDEGGPYGDHLRRFQVLLQMHDELKQEVQNVLTKQPVTSQQAFYRLRSAGVLSGASHTAPSVRCKLYDGFLRSLN